MLGSNLSDNIRSEQSNMGALRHLVTLSSNQKVRHYTIICDGQANAKTGPRWVSYGLET